MKVRQTPAAGWAGDVPGPALWHMPDRPADGRSRRRDAVRAEVTPDTVFRAMGGICASHDQPGSETAAREVTRLLYDGLRHTAPIP